MKTIIFRSSKLCLSLFLIFSVSCNNVNSQSQVEKKVAGEKSACGIENCHGLDIRCGPNVAQQCTMMYALGDFCREFARCEIIDNKCQLIEDPRFMECKACIENCVGEHGDHIEIWQCESKCRETLGL